MKSLSVGLISFMACSVMIFYRKRILILGFIQFIINLLPVINDVFKIIAVR